MKCPICPDSDLAMTSREGIEIDYCPDCRGVWLDRGELDKIIDRSADAPSKDDSRRGPEYERRGPDYERHDRDTHYRRPKSKKNALKELFDF